MIGRTVAERLDPAEHHAAAWARRELPKRPFVVALRNDVVVVEEMHEFALVAALILGSAAFGEYGLVFPLLVPAIGAVTALIGVFITRVKPGENALSAINRGFYISAVIAAVLSGIAAYVYLPDTFAGLGSDPTPASPRSTGSFAHRQSWRSSSASSWPRSSCG